MRAASSGVRPSSSASGSSAQPSGTSTRYFIRQGYATTGAATSEAIPCRAHATARARLPPRTRPRRRHPPRGRGRRRDGTVAAAHADHRPRRRDRDGRPHRHADALRDGATRGGALDQVGHAVAHPRARPHRPREPGRRGAWPARDRLLSRREAHVPRLHRQRRRTRRSISSRCSVATRTRRHDARSSPSNSRSRTTTAGRSRSGPTSTCTSASATAARRATAGPATRRAATASHSTRCSARSCASTRTRSPAVRRTPCRPTTRSSASDAPPGDLGVRVAQPVALLVRPHDRRSLDRRRRSERMGGGRPRHRDERARRREGRQLRVEPARGQPLVPRRRTRRRGRARCTRSPTTPARARSWVGSCTAARRSRRSTAATCSATTATP